MLPPFVLGASGIGAAEILELLAGLETHAQGDAFPREEYTAGQPAVELGLPPAGEDEGSPEGAHRADVADGNGVGRCGRWGRHGRGILRGGRARHDQGEHDAEQEAGGSVWESNPPEPPKASPSRF